jgi:hypothetical protein
LVPPLPRFFHAALGYTCMYYTSTFAATGSHLQTDSSQLIDATVIAQNEIDVTSIDGYR